MSTRIARLLLGPMLLSLTAGVSAARQQEPLEMAALGKLTALESPVTSSTTSLPAAASASELVLYPRALARLEERLAHYPDDHEASLLKGLILFKQGRLDDAQRELAALTGRAPKFHLAHLVQGDLLLAQTQTVTDIGATPLLVDLGQQDEILAQLRAEAEFRLKAYLDTLPQDRLPRSLLLLGESVHTAIVVDKESHRLYVYERQGDGEPPRLIRDFYVSTGKLSGNKTLRGDLRTPEGVYFITRHIPDSALPEKYGTGAFPLNYPNELDARAGKTGDGIWLHGTDNAFYSRPPQDSEGCVVLPNIDLDHVGAFIRPGVTPLVITARVDWIDADSWQREQAELQQAVQQWAGDWAGGDVEQYLNHYASDFWTEGYDLKSWQARKRAVSLGKSFQQVELTDLSLFVYPRSASEGREIVVASFRQHYKSNNFNSDIGKRLYLTREDGQWRVLYEGGQ